MFGLLFRQRKHSRKVTLLESSRCSRTCSSGAESASPRLRFTRAPNWKHCPWRVHAGTGQALAAVFTRELRVVVTKQTGDPHSRWACDPRVRPVGLPLDIKRFYAWDFPIARSLPAFTRSSDIRFHFNNKPDVIENMVARDGIGRNYTYTLPITTIIRPSRRESLHVKR